MTIHLVNDNIRQAIFGIGWHTNKESPTIALKPGDMASFDLDVFGLIPDGTACWVFVRQLSTKLYKQSFVRFNYRKGRGFGGTFSFCTDDLKLALTYYRETA
jgi:hypothetical protein